MTSKCKTCGHHRNFHDETRGVICIETPYCKCEKFQPEDEISYPNGFSHKPVFKKQKKGSSEEEKRKEYEKFFNEQMRIFKGHTDRINLRLVNKYVEMFFPERDKKSNG